MKIQPELLVIVVHIFLSLVYAACILGGVSRLRKEHILPVCLVPIFGLFLGLTMELIIRTSRQGTSNPDLESPVLDDDILWATLKSVNERSDLVPLEEAILIDDVAVRRRSMLETLYSDPTKFLSVLNAAKDNDDIETSHYATTSISKAQKDFQLSIQEDAIEVERHPDDPAALSAYTDDLGRYIRSGLLEESLLRNLRLRYSEALDRWLAMVKDDKQALMEKLRNAVEIGDFSVASDVSRQLQTKWPEDEQTWIESLRVCVEGRDEAGLKQTIAEIQRQEIFWTERGLELVRPWVEMTTS